MPPGNSNQAPSDEHWDVYPSLFPVVRGCGEHELGQVREMVTLGERCLAREGDGTDLGWRRVWAGRQGSLWLPGWKVGAVLDLEVHEFLGYMEGTWTMDLWWL